MDRAIQVRVPVGQPLLLLLLAAVLLLPGCLSAPVDRADHAAEARIAQAASEARQIAQDARKAADEVRAGAVSDVAARLAAERAATLSDLDARLTRMRSESVADVDARLDRQRVETLAALKAEREALVAALASESAAWREESKAWRSEVTGIRAQVGAALGGTVPAPAAAGPGSPAAPGEPVVPTWFQITGLALGTFASIFTTAKTVNRKLKAAKGATA